MGSKVLWAYCKTGIDISMVCCVAYYSLRKRTIGSKPRIDGGDCASVLGLSFDFRGSLSLLVDYITEKWKPIERRAKLSCLSIKSRVLSKTATKRTSHNTQNQRTERMIWIGSRYKTTDVTRTLNGFIPREADWMSFWMLNVWNST